LWIEECQRSRSRTVVNFSFLDRSRYFSYKQLLIYVYETEWTPFQAPCYSEHLIVQGIEPGTSVTAARKSDHYTTEAVGTGYGKRKLRKLRQYLQGDSDICNPNSNISFKK
jgi:hypothetical protein